MTQTDLTPGSADPDTVYTFSNSAREAVDQLDSLERYLDPVTIGQLAALDLPVGGSCWEIGAGAGSVAAHLASRVGSAGHVVATDINLDRLGRLGDYGNVTVVRHDVTSLTEPGDHGPYDLIHARLVLLHLPQREEILRYLASRLRPGGWLLLEEFDCTQPLHVYASRSDVDSEVFTRVTNAIVSILVANGADMMWSHHVHPAMRRAGLVGVHTLVHSESWVGGGTGARLHLANSHQLAAQLDTLGITPGELDRFRAIVADPGHAAASYLLVSTRGQRPA